VFVVAREATQSVAQQRALETDWAPECVTRHCKHDSMRGRGGLRRSLSSDRVLRGPVGLIQRLALQISGHEARGLVDERFHRFVRKHLGIMQHRVVRQRLNRGHAYK
jgi:hypothetical protein